MSIIDLTLATLLADNIRIQLDLERVINDNVRPESRVVLIKGYLQEMVINEMSVTKLQALINNNTNTKKTENG